MALLVTAEAVVATAAVDRIARPAGDIPLAEVRVIPAVVGTTRPNAAATLFEQSEV